MNTSKSGLLVFFLFLGLVALLPGAEPQRTSAQAPGVRSQDWTHTTAADFETGETVGVAVTNLAGGELCLAHGATTGVYTSAVITPSFPFNAIAPHWRAVVPDSSVLRVEMRVSTASNGWSPWYAFDEADWIAAKGQFYPETPLLLSEGQQFQYRVTMTAILAGQSPILDEMTVTVIDATAGPTTSQARAAAHSGQVTAQGVPQPPIIPRSEEGWDADETLRYVNGDLNGDLIWSLEYRTVEKIVVHHTVSTNKYGPDDGAGLVRAIYYYHAVTRGWGDIGYNYLVDKYGNTYEGRFGGPGVVGGHVYGYNYGSMGIGTIGSYGNTPTSITPTVEIMIALADLAAWEVNRSYIHPLESAPFYNATTPNLGGHRDYPPGTTACPGDYLYAELSGLRQDTWERIVTYTDQYHVDWLAWNTPPHTLLAGETYSLSMTVRNTGWLTWPKAGVVNAVRLGYHWLDDGGRPVIQPPEDDHRGPLDHGLTFGHTYDFEPALVTTPITPGDYTLAWDMVREGVAWFHDANPASPLLIMPLVITDTPPVTISGQLLDVLGRPVSGGQVALPNWIAVTTRDDGAYALPRLARVAYTLTASASGYAPQLPAYDVDATRGNVTYPFAFVPNDFFSLVANGDFEDSLIGWTRGGITTSLPVSTTMAHTGFGAVQWGGHVFSGAVWLSQTVDLPANALSPSLSLLYRVPISDDSAAFQVVLASKTTTMPHTLPLTATHWTHFWTDLPDGWGGPLDLQLKLTQSGSLLTPTTVLVDKVWLGYQDREPHSTYLPLALKAHTASGCTELMTNGGFEETAAWEILDTPYPAAYSTAQAHSGSRALRAGIEPGGEITQSYSSAQQTVTIPANTHSAVLRYWWYPVSDAADDLQYVLILDNEGNILDSLLWTNADDQAWLSAQADLTEYAGQALTLRFGAYNDGDAGLTRMYVDDVSLQACPPP